MDRRSKTMGRNSRTTRRGLLGGLAAVAGIWAAGGAAFAAEPAQSVPTASEPVPAGAPTIDPDGKIFAPETMIMEPRPVAYVTGDGKWDDAETILGDAFKSIYAELGRQNIRTVGNPMVEYLDSDDDRFSFQAMVPIQPSATLEPREEVKVGTAPSGPALKFIHHGSFDGLEQVYNRIDDYLTANHQTMKRVVEEYMTDQATTPPEKMVTTIYIFTE